MPKTARSFFSMPLLMTSTLVLSLSAGVEAKPFPIEEIAPRQSLGFVSVPNYPEFIREWQASDFGRSLKDPKIQEWFRKSIERLFSEGEESNPLKVAREWLESADLKLEDVPQPNGPIGMAVYLSTPTQAGSLDVHWVLAANFSGEDAARLESWLEKGLNQLERQKKVELRVDKYAGVEITEISIIPQTEEQDPNRGERGGDGMMPFRGRPMGMGADEKPDPTRLYLTRFEGTMVLAGHKAAAQQAVDMMEGKGGANLATSALYRETLATLPSGSTLVGGLFIEPLVQAAKSREVQEAIERARVLDATPLPIGEVLSGLDSPEVQGILKAVGVKGTKSVGLAFSQSGADYSSLFQMNILMPPPSGAMTLMDPGPVPVPPAFITADAFDLTAGRVRLDRVLDWVRGTLIPALPEESREMAEAQLPLITEILGPLLSNAGPEIFSFTSSGEITEAAQFGMAGVTAIRVRDFTPIRSLLTGFGPQMGLEPKDFEGFQIYSTEFLPFSLGLGAEYLFIGGREEVQNALRASRGGAPGLATDEQFIAGARVMEPQGFFYSWTNAMASGRHSLKIVEARRKSLREAGLNEDEINEALEEDAFSVFVAMPIEAASRYWGNTVTEMHWQPYGLRIRSRMLKP
jgi:hypothetical protein